MHRLIMDPGSQQPVVVLANGQQTHALLIWIDFFEANAIQAEIAGVRHRRPLTHDLLEKIIQQDQGKVEQITITHMAENIYYATLVMLQGSDRVEVDARPSDSIVMALKFNAPIYVTQTLFEERAIALAEDKNAAEQYGLTLQDLTTELAQYFGLTSSKGVLVAGVRQGSGAEADGIKDGDIFLTIEDQVIRDASSMVELLAEGGGSVLKAKVLRKDRRITLKIDLKR